MPHATRNPTNKSRLMMEQHASTASAAQLSSSSSIFRELDELQRTNPLSVRFASGHRAHESFDDLVEDGYDHNGRIDDGDNDELQHAIAMRIRDPPVSVATKPQAERDEDTADLEVSVAEEGGYDPRPANGEDKHMDPVALAQDYIDAGEAKRKRRRRIAAIACVAVLAVVGVAVALGVVLSANKGDEQQPASNKSIGEGSANVAEGGVQVASEGGEIDDGVVDDLLGGGASNNVNGSNNDNSRPASPPSTQQTPPAGTRYEELYNRVVSISGADVLQTGSDTPQLRALRWLDSRDAANILASSEDVIPRYVLAVLYHSLGGEQWTTLGTEWLSVGHVCTWTAVECTSVQNRNVVSKLNLANSNLNGSLPQEIGSLEYLEELSLHSNGAALSGEIPATIGNLSNLRSLFLQKNAFVGSIPSSLGSLSNLVNLLLNDNELSGAIPSALGRLSSLEQLHLYANRIEGSIPAELGNLSNLQRLWLSKNRIGGDIPAELGNLPNLKALYLDENILSGPITPEIANAASLEDVRLYSNMLTGKIPDTFQSLRNLVILYVDANFLDGPMPDWIGTELPKLQYLDLSMNRFSGGIPYTLGNLDELIVLKLSDNQLTETIPSTLGNLRKLQQLHLFGNTLRGAIPSAALAQLADLVELRLERNNLSGTVSDTLCALGIGEFSVDCEEVVCSCCSPCGAADARRSYEP